MTEKRKWDILPRFLSLQIWQSGDRRAPHKPLLLLWALGRCLNKKPRLAPFESVRKELAKLLQAFGPHRKTIHAEDPFWRLQNDGIWEIDRPNLVGIQDNGSPRVKDLRDHQIHGGLKQSDYEAFAEDPALALWLAEKLVISHFPNTLHDEVLEATLGIDNPMEHEFIETPTEDEFTTVRQRRRHSTFRKLVLSAYRQRCAVCEFSAKLNENTIALDAAHIMWHKSKGPPEVNNGLALCSLHHKLFDRGAFTLDTKLNIVVSKSIEGTGIEETLQKFHGKRLEAPPLSESLWPYKSYIEWHQTEVFKLHNPTHLT